MFVKSNPNLFVKARDIYARGKVYPRGLRLGQRLVLQLVQRLQRFKKKNSYVY